MTAILSKPIDQITAADIGSLVTSRVPEGDQIKFKRELPAKGTSNRDPWMIGQMKIGGHAKDQILKEVVSFANAYGGVLVLGIEEDKNATPPVAKAICAIPKCEELAGHGAEAVRDAIASSITTLPEQLRRSLTWDQGAEMAQHAQLRIDTGLAVYFCDPQSPWQRGTNENTNGLLRQYFPKGTDLSKHTADDLAAVAAALNSRPRKTLGWKTPAETLEDLLHR